MFTKGFRTLVAGRRADSLKIGRLGRFATKNISQLSRSSFPKRTSTTLGWVTTIVAVASVVVLQDGYILSDSQKKGVTVEELKRHTNVEDGVWVVINGQVYDLTNFLPTHPGGAKIILRYAGKDASKIFNKFHAKDVFEQFLTPEQHLGPLLGEIEVEDDITEGEVDHERLARIQKKPPISKIFNLADFEYICKQTLSPPAWAYYSSAADDEVTLRENNNAYQRVFFNPRVLVDVNDVDISTKMLGSATDAPFYCSGAALAKLGHPDGELSIARGCGSENIIQMISNSSSYTFDEIVDQAKPDQPQWFQMYVKENRELNFKSLEKCDKRGIKGIFVTVDSAMFGKRENDMRHHIIEDEGEDVKQRMSESAKILDVKDPGLTWDDIKKFKAATDIPIVLKGVQTIDDVLLAIEHNVQGVVLSNHGGRQLDYSRAPLEVLAEVMPVLREKKLDDKIEVYVDGGIRRGTDILKALCLGAKGVGLGRPFLYANSAYGEDGVVKLCQILKSELITDMKLLGAKSLEDLSPKLLDLRSLYARPYYPDMENRSSYVPLQNPKFND